jgi:hypothetical protein
MVDRDIAAVTVEGDTGAVEAMLAALPTIPATEPALAAS